MEKTRIIKERTGKVVSNKMAKTVVVAIENTRRHERYGKIVKWTKKLYAHTEESCNIGDTVLVKETRPMSRLKRWKVIKILERSVE